MRWVQLLTASALLFFGTANVAEAQQHPRRVVTQSQARSTATVQLTVVQASNRNSQVDPRLRSLARQLEMYRYSSYEVLEQRKTPMRPGATRHFLMESGEEVVVNLLSVDSAGARCRIQINRGSKELMNSTVSIRRGSHLIYGISRDERGALLLPITIL